MIPDADLEIARTEREAYHCAVALIQSQQLGELFANLPRQNGWPSRPKNVGWCGPERAQRTTTRPAFFARKAWP
jgi:hypothetical protein